MKIVKKYWLILIVMFGCTAVKKNTDNTTFIVQSSEIKTKMIDTTYFKSIRKIQLETNDHSLLRKIDRICYDENKIFIFDKSLNKVVIFDNKGKYLSNIQNIGQGPGEYKSVMDFCIDTHKKKIVLLCDKPYKIITYDYTGLFDNEKKIDGLYFNIITDSSYVFCNKLEIGAETKKDYELYCYSPNFEHKFTSLPLRDITNCVIFTEGNQMSLTLNKNYSRRFDYSIYQLNINKDTEKKYTIDFGKNSIAESYFKSGVSNDLIKLANEKNWVWSITDIAESHKYVMFKTNLGIYIYDKKNKELNGFKTIENTEFKMSSNMYYSINNSSKMVGLVIMPLWLSTVRETAKKNPKFDNIKLLKLSEKVNDEDNPILFLCEFKD